jgi:hypothetical protein
MRKRLSALPQEDSHNMIIDRNRVEKQFTEYASRYDAKDVKVQLKTAHTFRVAALADRIARSLALSREDTDIAWLLGMLHDIGRFEQLRQYHTFIDSKSVNHAALSADILFGKGDASGGGAATGISGVVSDGGRTSGAEDHHFIRDYIDDPSEDAVIEKAVRLHNVFALPEGLTERERMFCQILRDADKIDILKVNREYTCEEIYDVPETVMRRSKISDAVLEDALACRNVERRHVSQPMDRLVSHISLTYGLVYPESIRIVEEQGYLAKMLKFRSDDPETERRMEQVRAAVRAFLAEKDAGGTGKR